MHDQILCASCPCVCRTFVALCNRLLRCGKRTFTPAVNSKNRQKTDSRVRLKAPGVILLGHLPVEGAFSFSRFHGYPAKNHLQHLSSLLLSP